MTKSYRRLNHSGGTANGDSLVVGFMGALLFLFFGLFFIGGPVCTILGGIRLINEIESVDLLIVGVPGMILAFAVNIPIIFYTLIESYRPSTYSSYVKGKGIVEGYEERMKLFKKNRRIFIISEFLLSFGVILMAIVSFHDMSTNPVISGIVFIFLAILNILLTIYNIILQITN